MDALKNANLALRFSLELCMLAALAAFGLHLGDAFWSQTLLSVGLPVIAATVWGLLVSPKAKVRSHWLVQLAVEVALFGLAAFGLFVMARPFLGTVFAVLAILSRATKGWFDARDASSPPAFTGEHT